MNRIIQTFGIVVFLTCHIACQRQSNIESLVCDCIVENGNVYGDCLRLYFDDFIDKNGRDKELFSTEIGRFIESMQNQCPQFSEQTENWIDETSLNEITIDKSNINSINSEKCEIIREFDWIYSDLLEGDLIYRFKDNELEVKNKKYGDLTTYDFEIRENCQLKLTLKASNNPFELLLPFRKETKMYVTKIENEEIYALYQLDENLYKRMRLEKKK